MIVVEVLRDERPERPCALPSAMRRAQSGRRSQRRVARGQRPSPEGPPVRRTSLQAHARRFRSAAATVLHEPRKMRLLGFEESPQALFIVGSNGVPD